jgi:hypothetical protein
MSISEYILNRVCLDSRVTDGIFSSENDEHLAALQEVLIKKGISENDAMAIRNKMIEGKFPERQAYNTNGLLVTFPTPEYKQRAISRGTHFEENPKKSQANIFHGDATQPQQAAPVAAPSAPTTAQPAAPAPPESAATPTGASLFTPEPEKQQAEVPLDASQPKVDDRTPEEKKQDADAIQNILLANPPSPDYKNKMDDIEKLQKPNQSPPTLEEISKNSFYEKGGVLYTSDGKYVGAKWFCESKNKSLIIP